MLKAMALVPDVPMSTPMMYCMQGYLISIIVNNITPGLNIERMIQSKWFFCSHENIQRLTGELLIVDGYFLLFAREIQYHENFLISFFTQIGKQRFIITHAYFFIRCIDSQCRIIFS